VHLFVTGGTGFFGKALLRHWGYGQEPRMPRDAKVTLLTRDPERFQKSYGYLLTGLNIRLHKGDIMKPETLPQGDTISHILHAATDSTLGPQLIPLQRFDQIVDGTRHILDFAVNRGVKRVLLTSSGGVYGAQPVDMLQIPEDYCGMPDPMLPSSAYGVGKRAAEHLCALYQDNYGLETVVARCFAFVGPDLPLDVHFAIGNFIRDALLHDEIVVGGDGAPIRSYLHQSDLAVWLMTMLKDGRAGRAYNLGSDEGIMIADLAHMVRDIVAPGKPVRIMNATTPVNIKNRYVPSIERAKNELGLSVKMGLKQAIAQTVKTLAPQLHSLTGSHESHH
jgi:UDP-glucuronate decarboxylase